MSRADIELLVSFCWVWGKIFPPHPVDTISLTTFGFSDWDFSDEELKISYQKGKTIGAVGLVAWFIKQLQEQVHPLVSLPTMTKERDWNKYDKQSQCWILKGFSDPSLGSYSSSAGIFLSDKPKAIWQNKSDSEGKHVPPELRSRIVYRPPHNQTYFISVLICSHNFGIPTLWSCYC